ncbi:hypothetical protein Tco_0231486 [Tanacetum coccineum]
MADVSAPVEQAPAVAPPTRTDEQILPCIRWVPIGKSNCYLDAEKSQSNPIYKIAVDILKQTNFFRAFTASSTIPAIYIQQFWDTICYDRTAGVNNNKAFSSPPTQDTLINFVNDLGYRKEVKHLSNVTSGFERPRALVLQILWGIINRAHIDYTERMWEEFTQSIHTFTEDKKNLAWHTQGKKKATLIVIPSVRFTKLIIFHLQRKHKFHPRPESPLHLPTEEPILGYLKFSAKGTKREVFGMPDKPKSKNVKVRVNTDESAVKPEPELKNTIGCNLNPSDGPGKPNNIMADVNAPVEQAPAVAPPTRTDEQILPRIRWVPIGKSNCYLDAEKSQSNPIYKIAVDILKQTNFFRAFTASSTIPAIYIQQFWDTICYDRTDGGYKCQLDEQWFNLTKDTLRDALRITPVNNNKAFSSPPTQDTLINFVNDLGYPKEVKHLSNVVTNDMFQPWRALTTIINLCLTGKTSGFERPRAPVLQILWGIINRAHIDYAERMWEEFTQSIHTFTEDKKNLAQHTQGKKKATLIVIPSVRFTKLIIFHLQRKHKFHPRPESPLHLPTEEPILGYLKFSAKGTKREVFGMPIPNELITDDIRGADYYDAYLEKVAKHQRYLAGEEVSDPDSPAPKPAKSTKPKVTKQAKPVAPKAATKKPQPAPTKPKEKKRKQAKETTKATPPAKRAKAGKVVKKRTLKRSQQLVDEFVDEGIPLTEPEFGDLEADTQRVIEESLKDAHGAPRGPLPPVVFRETDIGKFQPLPEVEGKGKEKVGVEQAAQSQLLSTPGVHAGPNLEHTDVEATDATSQPQPGQIDEEFTATTYPNVQENLKLTVNEPVIPEGPASSTRTLSSLQHLAKDFSFGDQFFNDKPLEADNEKTTTDTEAVSMVSITIHKDTSSFPPMTSPVIDIVSRPDSLNFHQPLPTTATATPTTTTTITTLPLPPQPQQGPSDSTLLKHIGEFEQHITNLVDANQALEERLDKHGSILYRLENQDIPNQVHKAVDEIVTDAVDWAMQAPLRERFRDLPEADMKEILHNRMWESKSYQTHEDHMMLYEALEKSKARDNRDQLLSDLAKSRKKKKKQQGSPKTPSGSPPHPLPHPPPPPPPPASPSGTSGASGTSGSSQSPPPPPPPSNNQGGQSPSTAAPSSSKTAASAEYTA